MNHPPGIQADPALLYSLRLSPPVADGRLQGEIEHVLSGEVRAFRNASELLVWLRGQAGLAAGPARPDHPGAAPPRDATR